MNLINRTEVISAEKDLKAIRKALEDISHSLSPASTDTESADTESPIQDPFFGKIRISEEHLDVLKDEYGDKVTLSEVGLMEECSELIQALSKRIRAINPKKDNIIEEMAHVITCIRLVCFQLGIKPEDIQQEIYKKYPEGYDVTILFADNAPYYIERKE